MVDTTRSPAAAAVAPPRTDPTDRLFTSGWFRSLFVAELWERFGFYGMQAVLVRTHALIADEPLAES